MTLAPSYAQNVSQYWSQAGAHWLPGIALVSTLTPPNLASRVFAATAVATYFKINNDDQMHFEGKRSFAKNALYLN